MAPARNGLAADARNRTLGELVGQLAEETTTLMRQEVQLAKAELMEKVDLMREDAARRGRMAGLGSAFLAGAVVAGLVSAGLLATLLVALFDLAVPTSAAAAIVLALFLAVTAVLVYIGLERLRAAGTSGPVKDAWRPIPDQTIETLKEDVEWARHPTRSAQR
jgi:hypothetical protein